MDFSDSPLRSVLNSPFRKITPAVPTPDWHTSSPGRPIPSPVIARTSSLLARPGTSSSTYDDAVPSSPNPNYTRSSVITNSSSSRSVINDVRITDNPRTPTVNFNNETLQNNVIDSKGIFEFGPSSSRISGEVSFTPTHSSFSLTPASVGQNPHASIITHTPISSEPDQARNTIKLQNCVSTINLTCELKLLDIYTRTRFSEYNPSRFHGVVMRILEPSATALVFRSGKLVCTGAKNEQESLLAAKKFALIIKKLGYPVRFTDFKIQNFLATADLRFPIRLEALQQAHGQFTSYEPELFPGLIYRMVRPRIVLLIFVNGKIVFTGGKSRHDITEALNIIYPILRSFKKN